MVVSPDELAGHEPRAQPADHARRAGFVLVAIVLLVIVAALIIWGLVR
jgi:hypothetical protein